MTRPLSLAELSELSKTARRTISGDIEWTATQFREFMNATRDLCDAVDRYAREIEEQTR